MLHLNQGINATNTDLVGNLHGILCDLKILKRIEDQENRCMVKCLAHSSVVGNSFRESKMQEMGKKAFSEQWLIPEGFDDDSTIASENRASVYVEKDAVRNTLVNAFPSA